MPRAALNGSVAVSKIPGMVHQSPTKNGRRINEGRNLSVAHVIEGKTCVWNGVHGNGLNNGIGTAVVVGYHQFNVVGAGVKGPTPRTKLPGCEIDEESVNTRTIPQAESKTKSGVKMGGTTTGRTTVSSQPT